MQPVAANKRTLIYNYVQLAKLVAAAFAECFQFVKIFGNYGYFVVIVIF